MDNTQLMNTHIITNNTTTHLTNTNANSPRTPTTPIIQILNHLICGFFTSKAKSATRFPKSATLLKNIETLLKKNDKLKIPLLKHTLVPTLGVGMHTHLKKHSHAQRGNEGKYSVDSSFLFFHFSYPVVV